MNEKRKTKTSAVVKNRYNNKVYGTILVRLHKELVDAFKAKCSRIGVSQAQVIRQAIENFLEVNHAQTTNNGRPPED